jgi:phosphohistidine phosphatase
MRIFCLMRHAKSSRENPVWKDIERPLLPKGERRASVIAEKLALKGVRPDLILSSPAVRALATARILAKTLNLNEEIIQIESDIYHGDCNDLLQLLKDLPDRVKHVVLVGHNPHITELCNRFLTYPLDNLTTSGTVAFSSNAGKWQGINATKPSYLFTLIEKD